VEFATFGAGCFWGVEAAFRQTPGVSDVEVGYAGGSTVDPDYKQVCTGTTGHAEVVRVKFDPETVSYEQLVERFFSIHNPTTPGRQGPDVGTQYRSAIFFHSPDQQSTATAVKERLDAAGQFRGPIVTEITEAGPFYRAEEYHQRYFEKHGGGGCHVTQ
jgi:peptide-methionine (S)-S-oxide reductase